MSAFVQKSPTPEKNPAAGTKQSGRNAANMPKWFGSDFAESQKRADPNSLQERHSEAAEMPSGFDFRRISIHPGTPAPVQARNTGNVTSPATHPFSKAPAAPGRSGVPLDAGIRARYEPLLKWSLGDIRIHTGMLASASAEKLNAEAYTVGRDIVFNTGNYRPDSSSGQALLAHELAHAVQQQGRMQSAAPLAVSRPGDRAEREAASAAAALLAGRSPDLTPGSEPYAIHRAPKRANRFLPDEKAKLRQMGRGELDELIDQIIADNTFHVVHQETIKGVEHIWEVKTQIVELSEQEQSQGAGFGGAVTEEKLVQAPDGKSTRHQLGYILRGGKASTIESALHELIHLRIMIDKGLPENERSSFYSGYSELNELTEVMPEAKFGPQQNLDKKSSYGALPIVAGTSDKIAIVLRKIDAIRSFIGSQDAKAAAEFDHDPQLSPASLIEFITQEKYVSQTAAKASSAKGFAPSNDTVATRYARAVWGKFTGHLSNAAQSRLATGVGSSTMNEMLDGLRLSMKNLFDALDQAISQGQQALANPVKPPNNMPDPQIFESRPLGLDDKPIPFR